jgi:V/A-type H+-transporting ATPase subunit K
MFGAPEMIEIGRGLAYAGAGLAFGLAGSGSAWGIAIASHQAAGVLREKPDMFGKMLIFIGLPGTQGFYGFIMAMMIMSQTGLMKATEAAQIAVSPATGLALFFIGLGFGLAQFISAIYQGEAAAAGISLVARRPEAFGRAVMFPAFVETYAVMSLLAGLLSLTFLTKASMLSYLTQ